MVTLDEKLMKSWLQKAREDIPKDQAEQFYRNLFEEIELCDPAELAETVANMRENMLNGGSFFYEPEDEQAYLLFEEVGKLAYSLPIECSKLDEASRKLVDFELKLLALEGYSESKTIEVIESASLLLVALVGARSHGELRQDILNASEGYVRKIKESKEWRHRFLANLLPVIERKIITDSAKQPNYIA